MPKLPKPWRDLYKDLESYADFAAERGYQTPEEYAKTMMDTFDELGIVESMKQRKVRMIASSVHSGEKDYALIEALDARLSALEDSHKPEVFFTDIATTEGDRPRSVMRKLQSTLENIDLKLVACDMENIPLDGSSADVLFERLGALLHTAKLDTRKVADSTILTTMLKEYRRVLKPGGKIIIDRENTKENLSTATEMKIAVSIGLNKELPGYLNDLGFKTETIQGGRFLVLTNAKGSRSEAN